MPKQTSEDLVPLSIRVEPETDSWLRAHVEVRKESTNRVIRDFLNDLRTLFGLSPAVLAALEQDAQSLGIPTRLRSSSGQVATDWRPYLIDLLNQRALAVSASARTTRSGSPEPRTKK